MTYKTKLALTSASILVIAGATFAMAQSRNNVVETQKVAELATEQSPSAAIDTQTALPATATLTAEDLSLIHI